MSSAEPIGLPNEAQRAAVARADRLAASLRQLPWFGFGRSETLAFIYFWLYHRYLQTGPSGIFQALSPIAIDRQPLKFAQFLAHCFEAYLPENQLATISGIEVQAGLDSLLRASEGVAIHFSDAEFAAEVEHFLQTTLAKGNLDAAVPKPLAAILTGLYTLPDKALVYNPMAGNGDLIQYLPPSIVYNGETLDPEENAVLCLRMLLHGFPNLPSDKPRLAATNPPKADLTVCFPAFDREFVARPQKPTETPSEVSSRLVRNLLHHTADSGKVLLVVLDRYLADSGTGAIALQKALGASGFLDTVLSMPIDLFAYSGLKVSIVVLDKARRRNAPMRLMEAEIYWSYQLSLFAIDIEKTIEKFRSRGSASEVFFLTREKLVQWDNKPLLSKAKLELRIAQEIERLQSGEKLIALATILQKPRWENAAADGLSKISIPYLDDPLLVNRIEKKDLAKLPLLALDDKGFRPIHLTRPLILVPKYVANARPTILDAIGKRVAIHETIHCFALDSPAIDIDYLALEINSSFVQDQMREFNTYQVQPSLSSQDFLSLKIRQPGSLALQKRRLDEFSVASEAIRLKESKFQRKLDDMQQTEHQLLAVMGHELRPLLANVRTLSELTKMYIAGKEAGHESVSLGDKIGSRPKSPTIERTFELIDKDLNRMGTLFDSLRGLMASERSKMALMEVPLAEFARSLTVELAMSHLDCQFVCEQDTLWDREELQPIVRIDREMLALAIRNMVENAIVHGFDDGAQDNLILIYLSCPAKEDGSIWVALDCINNGKPFPADFTLEKFTQFGGRQGKTKGTGIGGFLIKRIAENHDGNFALLDGREIGLAVANTARRQELQFGASKLGDRPFEVGLRIELKYHFLEDEKLD